VLPRLSLSLLLFLWPSTAAAEVMDKEIQIGEIWSLAIVGAPLALWSWRLHWLSGLFVLGLWTLPAISVFTELTDPYVGPAILREAGAGYPVHCCAAGLLVCVGHVGGMLWRWHGDRLAGRSG
jgi:hypothetical protein